MSKIDEKALEAAAQIIYETWIDKPGYVSWVPRGNSDKQMDARQAARRAITAYLSALPPHDSGELVKRLRMDVEPSEGDMEDAADTLEAAERRIMERLDQIRREHAEHLEELERERDEARAKLNAPELHNFSEGVVLEASHQRERWGAQHDAGKQPPDWFWLIGYLAGKALAAHMAGNTEKALHHTISTAAACANWHAAVSGANTSMRPGIDAVARGFEVGGNHV